MQGEVSGPTGPVKKLRVGTGARGGGDRGRGLRARGRRGSAAAGCRTLLRVPHSYFFFWAFSAALVILPVVTSLNVTLWNQLALS